MPYLRHLMIAVTLLLPPMTGHAEMSGSEIVETQKNRHETRDEDERILMQLINSRGKVKERWLASSTVKTAEGLNKTMLKFLEPGDIRGVGLLTWEHEDGGDDQWLYLPATRKVKRIVSGGKKNKFMGTDLSFEDLRPENLNIHDYNLLRSEELNGHPHFVVEALPSTKQEKKESGYGKRIFWIRSDIFFTTKTEYYDKRERLVKLGLSEDLVNVQGDIWRSNRTVMTELKSKHKTVMVTKERNLNQGMSEGFFTNRNLKKMPR
jgi:hypothetical protein